MSMLTADCGTETDNNKHCMPPVVLWVNRLALFLIYFCFGLGSGR